MSVVLAFNVSPIDLAPVFPMLLSVDLIRMEKSVLQMMPFVLFFVFTTQIELNERYV